MNATLLARLAGKLGLGRTRKPPAGGDERHPWFHGFAHPGPSLPQTLPGISLAEAGDSGDEARPILFLARGHSGTRALAHLLCEAGVFMGDRADPDSLNDTWDSMYWAYGFERTLTPRLFRWGQGCRVNAGAVGRLGRECARRHLRGHRGGPWGFKTCGAMFCHQLYRYLYPRARYIHLFRDGRDVMLSHDGLLNLTGATPDHPNWDFFKIITYGLTNDLDASPFPFPTEAGECGPMRDHRFWVQAKSWVEHIRMTERLRRDGELAPDVHSIRYEDLCADPLPVLERLFAFLELDLDDRIRAFAGELFHTRGIGRWRRAAPLPGDDEFDALCDFMRPELELYGYPTEPTHKEQP